MGRVYKDPVTGERYPSVTTILGEMNVPGLMWWAARLAAETGNPHAHNEVKEAGGALGTLVHRAIQTGDFSDVPPRYREQLDEFYGRHPFRFLSQERQVFNRAERYAGTYDAVIEMLDTGMVYMIDTKTNKGGLREARTRLQLAAYINAEDAPKVDGAAVLWLGPSSWEFREVEAGPDEFQAFLAYRDVRAWRWENDR